VDMTETDRSTDRYARCIDISKRVTWDIDRDVLKGRDFDYDCKFLPDGLSLVEEMDFLSAAERRLLSQIQGRTYAYIFGLVERFINAKILEVSQRHWFGDQIALEALVRFSAEELKHQELFRRIERMIAAKMPAGYRQTADADAVAKVVMSKSTWSVLALTCLIELFVQAHYRESIDPASETSDLFRDVFLYHWREESQHAILDEIEWQAEDRRISPSERDKAVVDLIELVAAVDGILQAQAAGDALYFGEICGRTLTEQDETRLRDGILRAYRWQYIVTGVQVPRFRELLESMIDAAQSLRIQSALAPIIRETI